MMLLVAGLAGLLGCPEEPPVEVRGESGHVTLQTHRVYDEEGEGSWQGPLVRADPFARYFGEGPLLEGTEACLTWGTGEDLEVGPECFGARIQGPSVDELAETSACHRFERGETLWSFTPQDCEDNEGYLLAADVVRLRAIPDDEAEARLVPWPELLAQTAGAAYLRSGPELPDFGEPYGDTLLVAEGQPIRVMVALTERSTGQWVAWNRKHGALELGPRDGGVEVLEEGEPTGVGWSGAMPALDVGQTRVRLEADAEAELRLGLGASEWTAARLQAVDPSLAERLELVVLPWDGTYAARAFAFTGGGDLIHGAPVEWSVDGLSMAIGTAGDGYETWAGADYVDIADSCSPPSERVGQRSATLVAKLGSLRAQVDLEWTNSEAPESGDEDWSRSDFCRSPGCSGCGQAAGTAQGLGGLVLRGLGFGGLGLGLLGWRRRRDLPGERTDPEEEPQGLGTVAEPGGGRRPGVRSGSLGGEGGVPVVSKPYDVPMSELLLFEDTPPEVERVLIDGYRRMSSARKIARVRDLNWTLQRLALAELRARFPAAEERTLRLRLAARSLDRSTMIAAFGWDPEADG